MYDALKREVFEETGLKIVKIKPDIQTKTYSPKNDASFAFMPFCAQQQLKGGKPWIGFAFICEVESGDIKGQPEEVRDVQWMKKEEFKKIFNETPEKIFTLQLGVLDFYFNSK